MTAGFLIKGIEKENRKTQLPVFESGIWYDADSVWFGYIY